MPCSKFLSCVAFVYHCIIDEVKSCILISDAWLDYGGFLSSYGIEVWSVAILIRSSVGGINYFKDIIIESFLQVADQIFNDMDYLIGRWYLLEQGVSEFHVDWCSFT